LRRIALVGNPNCGKTTLFNRLTGLNQRVGNYPGITVDKRAGKFTLANQEVVELIDLPGAYSLSSNSLDEQVVQDILLNPSNESYPDLILTVVDATNLHRNLFLASQVHDLGIPMILILNMIDVVKAEGDELDQDLLAKEFGCPVIAISAKNGEGIGELKKILTQEIKHSNTVFVDLKDLWVINPMTLNDLLPFQNDYQRFKVVNHIKKNTWLDNKEAILTTVESTSESVYKAELLEISKRYAQIDVLIKKVKTSRERLKQKKFTEKMDAVATHPFWGLLLFLATFFIIFQAIFTFAVYPMEAIDAGMVWFGQFVSQFLQSGMINDFIVDGLIAGLGGVLVFIPQIMILFGLFTILEDTGYLARISFMTDGLLRKFGMNGKSIVPLVGGFACAVPSIMAARTIENPKERLITIFITPLMSCSARLPVYVFLVSFIAPKNYLWGFISVQGLVMMAMYLLGIVVSLLVALVINYYLRAKSSTSFILELPNYRFPNMKNILSSMVNKGKTFVTEAGKIIVIASLVLWVLAYFGPTSQKERIENKYNVLTELNTLEVEEIEGMKRAEELEYSYLGYIGKGIEPVIRPLGFDWKIGIALVASFAAREVFVGTMATIYSVEDNPESEKGLKAIKFDYATAFSLLIFYVFALQCLSTVAIVKQETGGWKWPIVQLVSFTLIAYVASWITFVLVS
jgi:ferrous iron transport protein B